MVVPATVQGPGTQSPPPSVPKRRKRSRPQAGKNVFRVKPPEPEKPPPPRISLPFLSAIVFPWYPEVLVRWVILSVGCSIVGLLFMSTAWSFENGVYTAGIALAVSTLWIGIFTFSYLAAAATAIITETAHGIDRVAGWPDADWREWFSEMLFYVPSLGAAVSGGYGIGHLWLLFSDAFWPPMAVGFFVLAPICLLSAIDANTAFALLTKFVVISLYRRWWVWLRFYAMAAVVGIIWPLPVFLALPWAPFYIVGITGPLMAAALLIYARLMGRVAVLSIR